MQTFDKAILQAYKAEVAKELDDILSYWINHTFDKQNGGFVGQINELNIADFNAPKGAVLNGRILWSFSEAYLQTKNQQYFYLATTAFTYIKNNFVDKTYGGVFWSLQANATPLETKKQIYALAFAMYGCVAYYK
jgi:cellobiose epimerase